MSRIRIGILGYDGVAAINLVGPLEAFSNAFRNQHSGQQDPCYEVVVVGCKADRFVTDTGVTLHAQPWQPDAAPFDTVIVPGGRGMRDDEVVSQVATWIMANAQKTRRIASVCTGVCGLAATG